MSEGSGAQRTRQVSGRPRTTSRTREPRVAGRRRRGRLFLDTSFGEAKEVSRRQAEQSSSASKEHQVADNVATTQKAPACYDSSMRIAIAQINLTVGDVHANADR